MGKMLEKYAGSLRFWVLIVACVYFGYSVYFAWAGLRDSLGMLTNSYIYSSLRQGPWWWLVSFYSSEGVSGSVAIVSRAVAGVFAVWAAYLFWRKTDSVKLSLRQSTCMAMLFEAVFLLAFVPSILTAIVYNSTSQQLFYFGHTPNILIVLGTLIPLTGFVVVCTPPLLKLRFAIKNYAAKDEVMKWACLTGVGYLFAMFWFNYTMLWAGEAVPYTRVYEQWGWSFVLEPANFVSFLLTVLGLFALAAAALAVTYPAIKKRVAVPNLTWVGVFMVALGGYFVFNLFYYYLTGAYPAHPSVWYEVIGPLHNPNLWAIALLFLGAPLIVYGKIKKDGETKTK